MSNETFTLTPEGAEKLCDHADEMVFWIALEAASCGDFGPLRALTGEAEEKPVAPDFRVGDVVTINGAHALIDSAPRTHMQFGWVADILPPLRGANVVVFNSGVTLLRRREFRAGECPPVAVGQDRDCGIGTRRVTRIDDGIATFDDGGGCRAEIAAGLRLAAPFTFAEAVEVQR